MSNRNRYLKLFFISTFLGLCLFVNTLQSQSNSHNVFKNNRSVAQKLFATLSAGIHWGDGRLAAKPIMFVGIGYYFTNGLSIKIEYSPVIVEAKNNKFPLFRYDGKELHEGDELTIPEYFLIADFNIFENIWFDLGFAPEKLFSIKTSLKYLLFLNNNIRVQAEYGLLIMGRPIENTKNFTFVNSMLMIGVNYLF